MIFTYFEEQYPMLAQFAFSFRKYDDIIYPGLESSAKCRQITVTLLIEICWCIFQPIKKSSCNMYSLWWYYSACIIRLWILRTLPIPSTKTEGCEEFTFTEVGAFPLNIRHWPAFAFSHRSNRLQVSSCSKFDLSFWVQDEVQLNMRHLHLAECKSFHISLRCIFDKFRVIGWIYPCFNHDRSFSGIPKNAH